jgi:predicted metal-dependent phosphoesterase TrpH
VIKWIHAAGGVAVLAHPLRYRMTNTKIQRMLSHLSNAGLDGVEVITANTTCIEFIHHLFEQAILWILRVNF